MALTAPIRKRAFGNSDVSGRVARLARAGPPAPKTWSAEGDALHESVASWSLEPIQVLPPSSHRHNEVPPAAGDFRPAPGRERTVICFQS